jgi:hypothetical protein
MLQPGFIGPGGQPQSEMPLQSLSHINLTLNIFGFAVAV